MTSTAAIAGERVRDPRRWAVTLIGLGTYAVGSRIWLPGLDPDAAAHAGAEHAVDLSIFAVGARPVLYGLALVEMMRLAISPLGRWAASSPKRSERLWQRARLVALAFAGAQALSISAAIERLDDLAPSPGPLFRFGVVAAIVGATAFLMWLARVMTERGVGDGLLLLLAAPFVAHPSVEAILGAELPNGAAPAWIPPMLVMLILAAVAILLASTRWPEGRGELDIWPPFLSTIVVEALTVVSLVAGFSPDGLPLDVTLVLFMVAQGGLIWLFAAWRGRASGAPLPPLLAEIVVSVGALAVALIFGVGGSLTGPWLILCVAALLSLTSGKAQTTGGLTGPTPTA